MAASSVWDRTSASQPGLDSASRVVTGDIQRNARHVHNGHRLARGDSGPSGLLVSRPLLEGQVRRRVSALPGVRVLANRIATGLLSQEGRVTGVRLADGEPIPADLVVDAGGRGSRTPFWLGELRMVNAYLERFHAAAAHDPELALRFLRVANLYDPPPSLMTPGALIRVLRSGAPRAVPVPA
ncbi:NAD(P)/FAD-dependent oxidoreductase [Nonomuraea sp. M3C6]|uniref:NAD(P)/FAD-dependent oxidoreductase n=1 Tax=Nonomuraea marmarensis TaxID=3351344 RepID=A0ABW7A2L0_9ACTN